MSSTPITSDNLGDQPSNLSRIHVVPARSNRSDTVLPQQYAIGLFLSLLYLCINRSVGLSSTQCSDFLYSFTFTFSHLLSFSFFFLIIFPLVFLFSFINFAEKLKLKCFVIFKYKIKF